MRSMRACFAALSLPFCLSAPFAVHAENTAAADAAAGSDVDARRAELLRQREAIDAQLKNLDAAAEPAPAAAAPVRAVAPATQLDSVVVTARRAQQDVVTGQTVNSIDRSAFEDTPAFSIGDVLSLVPGVTFVKANGPRDASISIRGSNERQTYGVRNIKVYEDGFPVTQPDGLARTDLTDPHAYGDIDVIQGPSSALYGNYATGGAIDFHTRSGGDIHGVEVGADFGSQDYYNDYVTAGGKGERYEYSLFASNVRGNPYTENNRFNTATVNLLGSYAFTPSDRVTLKFINNDLDTNLSIRLSLNQYRQNPYQRDCADAAAAGCGTVSLYTNGFNGAKQSLSAAQAGLGRNDRRTIAGARWDHDFDDETRLRTQLVFDNRDIKQPTSNVSSVGTYPSFNLTSDLTHTDTLFGRPATALGGVFVNYENVNAYTYNVMPGGGATLGGLTQTVFGHHLNAGLHARGEWAFAPHWTGVVGLGGEYTELHALDTNYSYPAGAAPSTSLIPVERVFFNVAPEASVLFAPTQDWQFHLRVGTGYGTPQVTNLFITPQGTFGNNTQLKTQKNVGVDLGAAWALRANVQASLTGFYEFFSDELVSQSAGANSQSYTFNAPASQHRGVELSLDWHPLRGLLPGAHFTAAYLYDNQVYTRYTEVLATGAQSASFDRDGKRIPGVDPNYLDARLVYDQNRGVLRGLGGFVELNFRDAYELDNANLLKAPHYALVNLDLHYTPPVGVGFLSKLHFYFDVQNLFNQTYVASAGNLTDTLNTQSGPSPQQNGADTLANTTGSIYAGSPRAFVGGLRAHF